jgi:hypothetical protein
LVERQRQCPAGRAAAPGGDADANVDRIALDDSARGLQDRDRGVAHRPARNDHDARPTGQCAERLRIGELAVRDDDDRPPDA